PAIGAIGAKAAAIAAFDKKDLREFEVDISGFF
ncbi:MAG: hypothetical protein JWR18_3988, partial [Segetibacter sp.]|nr:hypothetical protein [Segetibacter sp.]